MAKKLYIDMTKCRECEECVVECVYDHHPVNRGLKSLLETAAFQFTCRRCEDAPCIEVCPADALERNSEGMVERALNLCVACKSCVAICPFGTLMTQFFDFINEQERSCPANRERSKREPKQQVFLKGNRSDP